ncbi:MAG: response regulator [Acidobacteria bacterium]|nr:response regulator [Acidobacteriota bacterium]NIM60244.1 response regulator [Acidobacteriota bacterium]NIO60282.1 response regulator [Acidobacteriota bacterium]NIQ31337.1 response regulator [Acidobacteriota bacterium]NIQ86560.1 response regulator [Acidobacteriota bacterium]
MAPVKSNGYRVLVVDDDPAVLSTYRRMLRRAGFDAVTEADPRKVLENGHANGVDLLLLDYRMPGLDGLSLLAELRRRECNAPAILVSAYLNEDLVNQARMLGVAMTLEKPVDVRSLRGHLFDLVPAANGRPA